VLPEEEAEKEVKIEKNDRQQAKLTDEGIKDTWWYWVRPIQKNTGSGEPIGLGRFKRIPYPCLGFRH
jgi:hypothetical protein